MKRAFLFGLLLAPLAGAAPIESAIARRDSDFEAGKPMVAHVVVALCDNESQGIVPVPAKLGNGDDPDTNLYWGAMYGMRGWFRRSPDWRAIPIETSKESRVLDRVLFRREVVRDGRRGQILLLAEAWRGRFIADAIRHFLEINRGEHVETLQIEGSQVEIGGAAHLTAFVGHNGLMDFAAPALPRSTLRAPAHVSVVLACASHQYFSTMLAEHSVPLLTTSGLMAPEAYTLDAALTGWFSGESPPAVRNSAARAYARHQKASERAALRLFVVPGANAGLD